MLLTLIALLIFAPARDTSLQAVLFRMWPVGVGIILAILVALYRRKKAQERMKIMQAAAAQMGWMFSAEAPWNYISGLDRFTLFDQGHSRVDLTNQKEDKPKNYGDKDGYYRAARQHAEKRRNRIQNGEKEREDEDRLQERDAPDAGQGTDLDD